MARIIAVCKSEKKGMRKEPIAEGYIQQDYGLAGDAHADCATHRQVGKCVMPKEGVFAKVIRGGMVRIGDEIKVKPDGN
jgi:MOSC domain-containing protein YiiM